MGSCAELYKQHFSKKQLSTLLFYLLDTYVYGFYEFYSLSESEGFTGLHMWI